MIKHFVTEIGGIESYGIVSICLFVAVFAGALVWALRQKRSLLNFLSALPLDDGEIRSDKKSLSHEP
jgi:hypothetical protein